MSEPIQKTTRKNKLHLIYIWFDEVNSAATLINLQVVLQFLADRPEITVC